MPGALRYHRRTTPHRPMPTALRVLQPQDYPAVLSLWQQTEGVGLNESDTPEGIAAFLARNPGLSRVAVTPDGLIVGALLCGHDGRRGYLHHLAVATAHRGQGLGRQLVTACLDGLRSAGIQKCNLFLYAHHDAGRAFWEHLGWHEREDLCVLQIPLSQP